MAGGSTFTAIFDAQDNMSSALSGMASSGESLNSTLSKIAGTAAKVFAAKKIVDFGKEAMSVSREFESGMAEVFTLLPDMSKSAMDNMSSDVKKFVKETGNTLNDTTSALYQAISAGVSKDDAMSFMETANKAAVGGVSNLETAVDGLTSVTNAYGLENLSVARASDLMFQTVKLGKTTFGELSSSLYNVIPTAVGAGVSFDDVSAALAAMTAQGMPTASATVKLRQAIMELSNSGTEVDKTFKSVAGKSFKQFISEGGNLQGALQLLEQHAKKSGLGIADMFSSVQAGSAALALTGQGTEKFTQAIEGMANAAGSTDAAYETMENTSEHKIKKLKAAWEVMKADVGAGLSDAFAPAMETLSTKMPEITASMESFGDMMAKGVSDVIPLLTGLLNHLDVVKGGIIALGSAFAGLKIVNGVAQITSSFNTLAALFKTGGVLAGMTSVLGPAGVIAAGVGVVTAFGYGMYKAYEHSREFGTRMNKVGESLDGHMNKMNELTSLQKEVSDLQVTIHSDNSSSTDIESAQNRIEEIKELLASDYDLNINCNTDDLDKAVGLLNEKEYLGAKGDTGSLLVDLNKGHDDYVESKSYVEDTQKGIEAANKYMNDALEKYYDASAKGDMVNAEKYFSNANQWKNRADDLKNDKWYKKYQDEISAYDSNAQKAVSGSLSTASYELSNGRDATQSINQLKQALTYTGESATKYVDQLTLAQSGQESFDKVVEAGGETLSNYVSNYASIGQQLGMSAFDIAQGQGLLSNGFRDMQSALSSADPNTLSAVAASMTEYARASGSISGNQVIQISATGDVSVLDEATEKITQINSANNVDVSVSANGDISIMDVATGQMQTLSGLGAVSLSVNADGNIDVLNEAQQVIATVDSKTAELSVDGQTVGIDQIQQANSEKDSMEDKNTSLNVTGTFSGKEDISTAISYQGQLSDKNVTYTVNYVQNGTPPGKSATGTSYWKGGLTYVNDERGVSDPTELIYQNGRLFTYSGKNVLANLEKGAKIIKASETSAIMDGNLKLLKDRIGDRAYSSLGNYFEDSQTSKSPIPEYPAYANGTTSSADTFIAGDEGPELVMGKKGSTVFPANETNRILDRFEDYDYRLNPFEESEGSRSKDNNSIVTNESRHVIELKGSGKVQVSGNKAEIISYVMDNIKPILLEIFEQEIYEEGDRSVDF